MVYAGGIQEEMSRMDTATRIARLGGTPESVRMTPRQRRRLIKKAGRDPMAIVTRDDGMGYSPAKQGYKELTEILNPVSPAAPRTV
jgi:hypothetical protein